MTPTRNPLWDVRVVMKPLSTPHTDAHGNEVTERTSEIVYTARTPLPDGIRDTLELSFQVPDVEGETLTFPTIQDCRKGKTAWTEVPAPGQDEEDLEAPAPSFVVTEAQEGETGHGQESDATEDSEDAETPDGAGAAVEPVTTASDDSGSAMTVVGFGAGAAGLLAGSFALIAVPRPS